MDIYVAQLPDVFGYGITAYGTTAKEAEAQCRKEYRANNHGPGSGWHCQPWPQAKEAWGFRVFKVAVPSASLDGCEGVE